MEKYDLTKIVSVSNKLIYSEFYSRPELDLTLQQRKIIFYLISKINKDTKNFSNEEIDISDYCELYNIKLQGKTDREWLEKSLLSLGGRVFFYEMPNGSKEMIRWVDRINVDFQTGKITMRLSESLNAYLLQLKKEFTKFQLGYTAFFKSKYSYDLYLICKQYSVSGLRKMFYISADDIKEKILHGEKSYERFYDFNKYCLAVAVDEINRYTDITVSYEIHRKKKTATEVIFYVRNKRKSEMKEIDNWKTIQKMSRKKMLSDKMNETFGNDVIYNDLCEAEEQEQMSMFSEDDI